MTAGRVKMASFFFSGRGDDVGTGSRSVKSSLLEPLDLLARLAFAHLAVLLLRTRLRALLLLEDGEVGELLFRRGVLSCK